MSTHRHHNIGIGRMGSLGGSSGVPTAPPPPVIRTTRNLSRRSRSRSRSRSPSSPRSRNVSSGQNRSSNRYAPRRDSRGDGGRERGRRTRSRSQSPPLTSGTHVVSAADSYRLSSAPKAHPLPLQNHAHVLSSQQSISLITGDGVLPIIRRILDPEQVKIPRRFGEGARALFDRPELKEGIRRRFAAGDEEEAQSANAATQQPAPQQRVIAIIRESSLGIDPFRMNSSNKDRDRDRLGGSTYPETAAKTIRRSRSPSLPRNNRSYHRQPSPPTRERERERGIGGGGSGERDVRERANTSAIDRSIDKKRDLLDELRNREMNLIRERGRGDRELEVNQGRVSGGISKERVERDRPPNPRQQQRGNSPPVRILRERISRSRSHTPPPMPPEFRRQIMERQNRDLRSKLSRPAAGGKFQGKFDGETRNDFGNFRGRGGFNTRGRGGGGFRGREDGRSPRGAWEHDLFSEGDLKSK